MTVIHVVGSTRADHGGTSRSVPALCEALEAVGEDNEVEYAIAPSVMSRSDCITCTHSGARSMSLITSHTRPGGASMGCRMVMVGMLLSPWVVNWSFANRVGWW